MDSSPAGPATSVLSHANTALREHLRVNAGRCRAAVAVVVDSQSVKPAETAAKLTRGYDAAKKINGRKRHLVVDTRGLLMMVMVTPANLSDRNTARDLLVRLRLLRPQLTLIWAGFACSGALVEWARHVLRLTSRP
ncbi:transposase [Nonomuraea ceibae]|uniref:transposase n=1 Tax=Nonomuraea ceibae TaxID=1935170 RepID=UPI001FE6F2D8|nr:transposase [Nonomuraea ceibae]